MHTYLEFEKGIAELEGKAEELRALARNDSEMDIADEVTRLEAKAHEHLKEIYSKLTPWRKCQVARHPGRPHTVHYVQSLIHDFIPLAGDRGFAEDPAVISGIGRLGNRSVVVLGHEKGSTTEERVMRNFGMARPEGYRKAVRLMDLADRFRLPVISFVDTPGAYPGKGAEERGQAEAIARSTEKCLEIGVPSVAAVIGEGGSGGAVGIASTSHVIMLEHAIYSVISPEGCASILWKDAEKAQDAANALRLTSQDLLKLGIIDQIVPEPMGGAHRDPETVIHDVGVAISSALDSFEGKGADEIRKDRRNKFLSMGANRLD